MESTMVMLVALLLMMGIVSEGRMEHVFKQVHAENEGSSQQGYQLFAMPFEFGRRIKPIQILMLPLRNSAPTFAPPPPAPETDYVPPPPGPPPKYVSPSTAQPGTTYTPSPLKYSPMNVLPPKKPISHQIPAYAPAPPSGYSPQVSQFIPPSAEVVEFTILNKNPQQMCSNHYPACGSFPPPPPALPPLPQDVPPKPSNPPKPHFTNPAPLAQSIPLPLPTFGVLSSSGNNGYFSQLPDHGLPKKEYGRPFAAIPQAPPVKTASVLAQPPGPPNEQNSKPLSQLEYAPPPPESASAFVPPPPEDAPMFAYPPQLPEYSVPKKEYGPSFAVIPPPLSYKPAQVYTQPPSPPKEQYVLPLPQSEYAPPPPEAASEFVPPPPEDAPVFAYPSQAPNYGEPNKEYSLPFVEIAQAPATKPVVVYAQPQEPIKEQLGLPLFQPEYASPPPDVPPEFVPPPPEEAPEFAPPEPQSVYGPPPEPQNTYGLPNKEVEYIPPPPEPQTQYGPPQPQAPEFVPPPPLPLEPIDGYITSQMKPETPLSQYGVPAPPPQTEYGPPPEIEEPQPNYGLPSPAVQLSPSPHDVYGLPPVVVKPFTKK